MQSNVEIIFDCYLLGYGEYHRLALRNQLMAKTEQTCPDYKHLDNVNNIAILLSSEKRLMHIVVPFLTHVPVAVHWQ